MTIDDKIAEFKQHLKSNDEASVVRRFITSGDCYVVNQDKYLELKSTIADHFQIHPNEVLIVGSGKLGFSIAENLAKSKPRYRHFSDSSDIDVAIISQKLFDTIWKDLYDYIEDKGYWQKQKEFTTYHFTGWMRPDMLPSSPRFDFTQTMWWDFFNNLTSSQKFGDYKIRGGLYRNWHFLEKYQMKCVKQCKIE